MRGHPERLLFGGTTAFQIRRDIGPAAEDATRSGVVPLGYNRRQCRGVLRTAIDIGISRKYVFDRSPVRAEAS